MRKRSVSLLLFVFGLIAQNGLAQNLNGEASRIESETEGEETFQAEITILVRRKGSGDAMRRVEVKVGNRIWQTGPDGKAEITITDSDDFIFLKRFGYLEFRYQIKDEDYDRSEAIEVFLQPSQPPDDLVIVRGSQRPEVSKKRVSVDEAKRIAPGGDPVQITKLLPGVQARPFQPQVTIRGSGPNDSGYYLGWVQIPSIYHTIGNISVLPDQLLEDIDFSAGGFGPERGNRHGGTIVLHSKSEVPDKNTYEVRWNLPLFISAFATGQMGKDENGDADQAWAVSLRRSYFEAILPLFLTDGDQTVVPYFGDVHGYHLTRRDDGYSKIFVMGSMDGLQLAVPSDSTSSSDGQGEIDVLDSFQVLSYEYQQSIGGGWSYNLTPYLVRQEINSNFFGNKFSLDLYNATVNWELRKRLDRKRSFYFGLSPSYVDVKASVFAPVLSGDDDPFFDPEEAPKVALDATLDLWYFAGWAAYDIGLGPVVLTPGVRGFYNGQIKESDYDPRLSMRWPLGSGEKPVHTIKAAAGQYSQSPEPVEASEKFGNPEIYYEQSMHYVLGLETKWSDRLETDFQVYYKPIIRLISTSPRLNYENTGRRESRGFEVFVRRNPSERWFAWASYTYSQTRERQSESESFHRSEFDQTHVLNLAGSYRFTGMLDVGGRLTYNTGETYTPIRRAVYNSNLDKYQPRVSGTEEYSARRPDFHQADIYSSMDFLFDYWKLTARLGVQFLAIEPQVFGINYNYDYSEEKYFRGVPPIPYIELRGVF